MDVRFLAVNGRQPVKDWLGKLSSTERDAVKEAIAKVGKGFPRPVGKSLYRRIRKGLYEVKAHTADRQFRVFFVVKENRLLLVHGFIKKTQETPKSEIETALNRLKH